MRPFGQNTQRMRYTMAMLTNYLRVVGAKPKQIYKYTCTHREKKRKRERQGKRERGRAISSEVDTYSF